MDMYVSPAAPTDLAAAHAVATLAPTSTPTPTPTAMPTPPPLAPPVAGAVFAPPAPTSNVGTVPTRPDAAILLTSASAMPTLPEVVLPVPVTPSSSPVTATSSYGTGLGPGLPAAGQPVRRQRDVAGGVRRFVARVFMLAIVAAIAAAGAVYGPELVDRFRDGDDAPTSVGDEPPAPLVLPPSPATPPVVRTATVGIERVFANGGRTESTTMTADFETGATRTVFDRVAQDVEVLTLFDDAVVRPLNAPVWYKLSRGTFATGATLDRNTLVPTIDVVVPPEQRATTLISAATFSSIAGIPVTHLVLQVNGAPVEIWVDNDGLVRKQIRETTLGTETTTVTDVSAEAWLPEFPQPDQVQPITAAGLVELGL